MIWDDTICALGEGPLWHPERQQFFWFDIMGKRLHTKGQHWQFGEYVSAAGWIDHDRLLIASQTKLSTFDLNTGTAETVAPLEADNPITRSNDGRADPHGGFWIGTMGILAEPDAGAIWRYYRGELRRLFAPITISNSICFSPDGTTAYYADTARQIVIRTRLDAQGWPKGDPVLHLDLTAEGLFPDGSVVDAAGNLWNAQWGASRVACYNPAGKFMNAVGFPATQTSCPAFGGPDLTTLFCTTAKIGLPDDNPDEGKTFAVQTDTIGQAEHRVIL